MMSTPMSDTDEMTQQNSQMIACDLVMNVEMYVKEFGPLELGLSNSRSCAKKNIKSTLSQNWIMEFDDKSYIKLSTEWTQEQWTKN